MGDYQGWTNHATWHINTILTNDQATLIEAQKTFDKAYYRARSMHFLAHRVEDVPYEQWPESDRQGIFGAADEMKKWVEERMEECVNLDTTAAPPIKTRVRMQYTPQYAQERKRQLAVQQSMRFIAQQAIQSALDACDWVEVAEAFDERRKELLAAALATVDQGPREEATNAV